MNEVAISKYQVGLLVHADEGWLIDLEKFSTVLLDAMLLGVGDPAYPGPYFKRRRGGIKRSRMNKGGEMYMLDKACAKGAENIDLRPHMSVKLILKEGPCIFFKGKVPMWRTMADISNCKFFIAGGEEDEYEGQEWREPYMIVCRDSFDDMYTYGNWKTLGEVLAWIENPTRLY